MDAETVVESLLEEVVHSTLPKLGPGPEFNRAKLCLRHFYRDSIVDFALKTRGYMCKDGNKRMYREQFWEFESTVKALGTVFAEYAVFEPDTCYDPNTGLPEKCLALVCPWIIDHRH